MSVLEKLNLRSHRITFESAATLIKLIKISNFYKFLIKCLIFNKWFLLKYGFNTNDIRRKFLKLRMVESKIRIIFSLEVN